MWIQCVIVCTFCASLAYFRKRTWPSAFTGESRHVKEETIKSLKLDQLAFTEGSVSYRSTQQYPVLAESTLLLPTCRSLFPFSLLSRLPSSLLPSLLPLPLLIPTPQGGKGGNSRTLSWRSHGVVHSTNKCPQDSAHSLRWGRNRNISVFPLGLKLYGLAFITRM